MEKLDLSPSRHGGALVGAMIPPEGIADIYTPLVKRVEALHGSPICPEYDLRDVIEKLAERGVVGLIGEGRDPQRVSPYEYCQIISNLGAHLGFSQGTVVVLNSLGTQWGVMSCDLRAESVERHTYLGSPLIVAEVAMRVPAHVESLGFSLQNLALYDPVRAYKDSVNGLSALLQSRGVRGPHAYAAPLCSRIVSSKVSAVEYAHVCGVVSCKMEEAQHAKDHIFCTRLMPQEDDPRIKAMTLLRDGSGILELVMREDDIYRKSFLLAGVAEYSGALGGTVMAMASHLNDGFPDRALLAFDDFLWVSNMRAFSGNVQQYNVEATLFFTRLADLIGEQNIEPFALGKLLASSSTEKQAENSLQMLQALYRTDFYGDDERESMCAESETNPACSP